MGDGHRTAGGDLLFKERNNTAPTAEDVPKPDGAVLGLASCRRVLNDHFRYPLGSPHDAGAAYLSASSTRFLTPKTLFFTASVVFLFSKRQPFQLLVPLVPNVKSPGRLLPVKRKQTQI